MESARALRFASSEVDVNATSSLLATIFLAVVGAGVFIVQPGFVQGMVQHYGFSEQQAGYIASIEVWGIAASSILLAFGSHRCNWRTVLYGSLLLFAVGNALSALTSALVPFAALRFAVGLGAGALISLTFTITGLTRNPDRNFGLLVAAVLVYAALVLWAMPAVMHAAGLEAVLFFFAILGASGWLAVRFVPRSSEEQPSTVEGAVALSWGYRTLALLAMFVFFLAQGGVWAYLFLIGLSGGQDGGLSEQAVANGLMLSGLVGIGGAFVPVLLGQRLGRALPLAVSILGGAILLSLLAGRFDAIAFGLIVSLYGFAWNMTHPYLLASVAGFDTDGRLVTWAVAAQMTGLAVGPAVAASLLKDGDFTPVIWAAVGVFVLSYVLILLPLLAARR